MDILSHMQVLKLKKQKIYLVYIRQEQKYVSGSEFIVNQINTIFKSIFNFTILETVVLNSLFKPAQSYFYLECYHDNISISIYKVYGWALLSAFFHNFCRLSAVPLSIIVVVFEAQAITPLLNKFLKLVFTLKLFDLCSL